MRIFRRNFYKNISIFIVVTIYMYLNYTFYANYKLIDEKHELVDLSIIDKGNSDIVPKTFDVLEFFPESKSVFGGLPKIDWHNYTAINLELKRVGPGEQGVAAPLIQGREDEMTELFDFNGFNALMSDSISLDRALTDIRHDKCKTKKYNRMLPTVTVVIPFFEEHWTTILRTVVSVINRSPPSILKEIILVDDGSHMKAFLGKPLDKWLAEHYDNVRVLHLPERVGLIGARLAGAKEAKGEVLIVLDSHCEVIVGWLPPLLEPIVENPRVAVCPLIDIIHYNDFSYIPAKAIRGAFDWKLFYKRLPLPREVEDKLPEPFESPVMNGCILAISMKFFWELGGYDSGIKIWGGEQYNLSFKIWMCGGRLLDAPCSRVGHIYRQGVKNRPNAKNAGDYINVNFKRVAVGWMDEYIEALYMRNRRLRDTDEGDMSAELAIKKKLQCKSFKWFLETVAPDLLKVYPVFEPPDFANGTIQSVEDPAYCVDTGSVNSGPLILYVCHVEGPQFFSLSYKKMMKTENEQFCWRPPRKHSQPPDLINCMDDPNNDHIWRYDTDTKTLQEKQFKRCLQANINDRQLTMETCSPELKSQQWNFKFVNNKEIADKFPAF